MIFFENDFRKVAIGNLFLSVVLLETVEKLFSIHHYPIVFKAAILIVLVALLWNISDKYLWNKSLFRIGGIFPATPDLSGRWVGTIDPDGEDDPQKFVVEITQTMSEMRLYAYSKKYRGWKITSKFIKDDNFETYKLITYWTCMDMIEREPRNSFKVSSVFDIIGKGEEQILRSSYFIDKTDCETMEQFDFTTKSLPSNGVIQLKRESAQRLGRFEQ